MSEYLTARSEATERLHVDFTQIINYFRSLEETKVFFVTCFPLSAIATIDHTHFNHCYF